METKICCKCHLEKPLSDFYSQKHHSGGVMSMCKECFNSYCIDRWRRRKVEFITLLGGECKHCGLKLNDSNSSVFDFHHKNTSEKEYVWSKLRLFSRSRILAELAKCELLCANCHRLEHWEEF